MTTDEPLRDMAVDAAPYSVDEFRQIRVWLDQHAFIDHIALDTAAGEKFEDAMRREFASHRVTNDPYELSPRRLSLCADSSF